MEIKFMILRGFSIKNTRSYLSLWYSELPNKIGKTVFDSVEETNEVIADLKLRYEERENTFTIVAFTLVNKI